MAVKAGTAFVEILPDTKKFAGALTAQTTSALVGVQRRLATVGSTLTKYVTLPVVGLGVLAIKSAEKVDDAFDTIRAGTGDTGKALEALKEDFRKIAKTTPHEMEKIADVMSLIRTRTGLIGTPLQNLTKQILEMGRLLKEEIDIDGLTRAFGDWAISTKDMSKTMDILFRVAQLTGVSTNKLLRTVVAYGAPLRLLGFGFNEAVALISKFEKEGVNTQNVLAGMGKSIHYFVKKGIDPSVGFPTLVKEIKRLYDAGEIVKAQDLAKEAFGAKTWKDAYAAIAEGRFAIQGLIEDMEKGKDTIMGVADETKDFREQWVELKNKATIALETIGTKLFPPVSRAIGDASGKLEILAGKFSRLSVAQQDLILKMLVGVAVLGPVVSVFSKILLVMKWVGAAIAFIVKTPIALFFLGLASVVIYATTIFRKFREAGDSVWKSLYKATALINPIKMFIDVISSLFSMIISRAARTSDRFRNFVNSLIRYLNVFVEGWNKTIGRVKMLKLSKVAYLETPTTVKIGGGMGELRKYERGGYVPETGLAYLHKGEYVLPREEAKAIPKKEIHIHIGTLIADDFSLRKLKGALEKV